MCMFVGKSRQQAKHSALSNAFEKEKRSEKRHGLTVT